MSFDLEKLNIVIEGESSDAITSIDLLIDRFEKLKTATSSFSGTASTVKKAMQGVSSSAKEAKNASSIITGSIDGTNSVSKRTVVGANDPGSLLGQASKYSKALGVESHKTYAQMVKDMDAANRSIKDLLPTLNIADSKFGQLFASIKRIALYRLIRSGIKAVTAAAREGLEILVEWDRAYGNNTSYAARTTDELAAKWREVKKSVGAAIMPIIQLLQPALTAAMNLVISIANAINQVVRGVQGYSDYMKATYHYTQGTVGAAKELKRVLFGFDELNVLPSETGSGGGLNVSPIEFEPTGIEEKWIKVGKTIRSVWDGLKKALDPVIEGIKKALGGLVKIVEGVFTGDIGLVLEGFGELVEGTGEAFVKTWELAVSGAQKVLEPLIPWINEHIIDPINRYLQGFYDRHPILARLLGKEGGTLDAKINVNATSKLDENTHKIVDLDRHAQNGNIPIGFRTDTAISNATNAMLAGVNAATQAALWVKFKTDTTLSPDTQKLIGLMSANGAVIGALGAVNVRTYATGGDVDMGTLFYAGERGAEVVANTPGGTGVMNMKQMQDAVSNGNAQTVNAVYAMANMIVSAINSKDVNSYLDGRLVTDVVARGLNNRTRATGQPAIAR